MTTESERFESAVEEVFRSAYNLLLKKHHDYGPKNISDSPGGALNGIRVRMFDKLARINNLIDSGAEPKNESVEDSFIDLLNYSAIALLYLRGDWPGSSYASGVNPKPVPGEAWTVLPQETLKKRLFPDDRLH